MEPGLIPPEKVVLATDLYQLTMSRGYKELKKENEMATFDLFVRKLPENRSYLVIAGLEQAVWYLTEGLRFDDESVEFLKEKKMFRDAEEEFWDYLEDLRFSGDVWAIPEGEIAFANEPLLRVTAPIIEAQLVETYLLSIYNHQTKIASKAARCFTVADGRPIVEFGSRRTDPGAAVRAARAAYIGGAIGTSNVLAEYLFDVPSFGTHAHSWVMSFATEEEAFHAYFEVFGENTIALIDTYDTVEGAKKASSLPGKIKGVRIDSGDLVELSREVREILDRAGKKDGIIFASSDLNEYKIYEMLRKGARIDAFGVGTELTLSSDAPVLGGVYKLSQLDNEPKLKSSKNKATLPGIKQVYRFYEDGKMIYDIISLEDEKFDGKPLLERVVKNGKPLELPNIHEIREKTLGNLEKLPEMLKDIHQTHIYPLKISPELLKLEKNL